MLIILKDISKPGTYTLNQDSCGSTASIRYIVRLVEVTFNGTILTVEIESGQLGVGEKDLSLCVFTPDIPFHLPE